MNHEEVKDAAEPLQELAPHLKHQPLATAHTIASIALSLALKYHDIGTVKDGVLYQQYKLEGRNFTDLHLDMVFETAERMEVWLLSSSDRIADLVVEAISTGVEKAEQNHAMMED